MSENPGPATGSPTPHDDDRPATPDTGPGPDADDVNEPSPGDDEGVTEG